MTLEEFLLVLDFLFFALPVLTKPTDESLLGVDGHSLSKNMSKAKDFIHFGGKFKSIVIWENSLRVLNVQCGKKGKILGFTVSETDFSPMKFSIS